MKRQFQVILVVLVCMSGRANAAFSVSQPNLALSPKPGFMLILK